MADRPYLASHPWLDFELDLRSVRPDLWISLGEIVRGAEVISSLPLDPEDSARIAGRSMVLGLHGMVALQGNLIEPPEIEVILDRSKENPVYTDGRVEEVLRVRDVLRYIHDRPGRAQDAEQVWDLSSADIAVFNGMVQADGPPSGSPFRYRDAVDMGYRGVPPGDCEYLLERLCTGLSEIRKGFPSGNRAVSGILRGVLAHAYLAWIMPFAGGNCLTGRISEYQIMRSGGIPWPVLMLLQWYYNRTSGEYWRLLGRSGQKTGDLKPLIAYVLTGLLEAVSDLSRDMTRLQSDVIWANHIRAAVARQDTRMTERQQILIEDISAAGGPVKTGSLAGISARVSRAYSECSDRTLARDVNMLIELGLLERVGRTLRPRKEKLKDHEAPFKG